jgi:hypothetical protein
MFIYVSILFLSGTSYGGLFGPGKSDEARVVISLSKKKCNSPNMVAFTIKNGSSYKIARVRFKIIGSSPGRSTEYPLGSGDQDKFLDPSEDFTECYYFDSRNLPILLPIEYSAIIETVDFK